DRPGRAAAQHARPSAHLRARLCAGLRHECRALHSPDTALRRLWRSRRDLALAHLRDRAAVLDRAATARPARAGIPDTIIRSPPDAGPLIPPRTCGTIRRARRLSSWSFFAQQKASGEW